MKTERLGIPYIAPAQAQKHVTHNEALRMLDALIQASVASRAAETPPVSPEAGEAHIVAEGATGAWAGRDLALAVHQDGAWEFFEPGQGWRVWVADEATLCIFEGSAWRTFEEISPVTRVESLGINTDATAPNLLAVSGAASLFDHAGAGHQVKINRASTGTAGSLLFQTAYSGRAEIGLPGNDDLRIKVSSDGSVWRDALAFDRRSGGVSARFLDSIQFVVAFETVAVVQPPSSGGIVFLSVVDPSFPQNPTASIFAYDVGGTPMLTTMVIGSMVQNLGTATLTGTTGVAGRVGCAVDGVGNFYVENRFTGGAPRQVCMTFVNSYRQLD